MTSIWKRPVSIETISKSFKDTAAEHLGIEFLEIGEDFLRARIPVDRRTRQPYGVLHGGVSVALAETLGSAGSSYACPPGRRPLGLDINANHMRSVSAGWVTAVARPVHLGRSTHVWHVELTNEEGQLVCVSRLTLLIMDAPD